MSMMKTNLFTTKILDIIAPKKIDYLNYIFIVMELMDSDLKKLLHNSKAVEFD